MLEHRWVVAEPISEDVKRQHSDRHPVLLQLLHNRDVTGKNIERFLNPDFTKHILPPTEFRQMKTAVDRIFGALEHGEMITIHGDYDADGVCGTTALFSTLRELCRVGGFNESQLSTYIPHREIEGYGLSVETVEKLDRERATKLIITVDCGISNKPAIDRGKELGIDTIVCDHHTIPEALPESAILIHPLVDGETYENKHLCGTGVAAKLATALIHEAQARGIDLPKGHEKWLLDLVAIATVTDVMPLLGENRALEHFGLIVLNKTRRPGLKELFDVAGVEPGTVDTTAIGFQIGPRINAAGRMNHADDALRLLIEEDPFEAKKHAAHLQKTNLERRTVSDNMYEQAKAQIGEVGDRRVLFAVHDEWSPGIVGLVAGKLVRDFHRPTYVIGKHGETYVGSGRSVPGFHVTEALHSSAELLDKYGGHPEACGFSVTGRDKLDEVFARIEAYTAMQELDPVANLQIDAEIPLEAITWDFYDQMMRLAPFGQRNPVPTFCSFNVLLKQFKPVGSTAKHLKLEIQSDQGTILPMIGFGFGDRAASLSLQQRIDVVYHIEVNEWNGRRSLQLHLIDLRSV